MEAKAGVGRRWLEGAGDGDPGKAVKALPVRAVWIFAEWMQGHLVNEAPSHLYETGSPRLSHPKSLLPSCQFIVFFAFITDS